MATSVNNLKEAGKNLPENWEVFYSKKSNRLYYFNNITKKTQWHYPNADEKKDSERTSKKRKVDHQTPGKPHQNAQRKTQGSLKREDQPTNNEVIPTKSKRESLDSTVPERTGNERTLRAENKAIGKPVKPLPNGNTREVVKPHSGTAKQSIKSERKTNCNEVIESNVQGRKLLSLSDAKKPTDSVKKDENQATTLPSSEEPGRVTEDKTLAKLQTLTRSTSLGEGSDSGVSDSSDRILAWLADTSRINFKHHPVPIIEIKEEDTKLDGANPSVTQANVETRAKTITKQKSDKQKLAILGRVSSNSETIKQQTAILDELLPKRAPFTHEKKRFLPYKLTKQGKKRNKANDISEEPVTNPQNFSKTNRSAPSRFSSVDQNSASVVSKKMTGKSVTLSQASRSCQNTKNFSDTARKPVTMVTTQQPRVVSSGIIGNQSYVTSTSLPEDDVISMDECGGSDVSIPLSTSDVMEMEIDNPEAFAKEIVKELKEMRSSVIVNPNEIPKDHMDIGCSNNNFEGSLFIVLDTNVLLSHLKFVIELKDYPIPGIGMPVLVIPWIVIQELDSLKENRWKSHENGEKSTRVDLLARVSIKFLNSAFQKNDARVRGQTVKEAAERIGNIQDETNDDRILQCCLLFQDRAENGCCVLFSNDVNLCNKAMVNGIKAFNHEKLLPGLKSLFQCGAIVKQNSEEYNMQVTIEQNRARQRQKADDILCELQIILREGISYIIEIEMKKAYDDLWMEIVHIKPPWTLIDVLQLLEKHWIAVFGHIIKRDKKKIIDSLRQKFDDRKGTASSLQFCSEMLKLALELFQSFAYHSNYDDAMPKCLAAVNVLVKKCEQFGENISKHREDQIKCITYPSTSSEITIESDNSFVRNGETTRPCHDDVMNTFNLIWTAVTQFSTQIFTALGYPLSFSDCAQSDYPKASKEEAISFLRVLGPKLVNLVGSIQNILRDPWEKSSLDRNLFMQLEHAISSFLKEILSKDNETTAEKLFKFCDDVSMRASLVQGLSQLDRASSMLQHCASFIS